MRLIVPFQIKSRWLIPPLPTQDYHSAYASGGRPRIRLASSTPAHTHAPHTQTTSRHRLEAEHRLKREMVAAIMQLQLAAPSAVQAELHNLGHPAVL